MTNHGQGILRKALRLFGAGVPLDSLAADELFCIRPGAAPPMLMSYGPGESDHEEKKPYRMEAGGIAVIAVTGVLSEHPSIYRLFGCSDQPTLGELRAAVCHAADDDNVLGIMLYVKSPGGTAAGTPQLAEAVAEARMRKPVHAYAENVCASAAYHVSSQASRLTAHRAAQVGSIGAFAILLDASKAAAAAGLKFHVIATGPYKGAGVEPGAGITPAQLEYFQSQAQDAAEIFYEDVAAGRGLPLAKVRELGDGRCHIAARAEKLGLCDGVESWEAALEGLRSAIEAPVAEPQHAPPPPDEPADHEEPHPDPPYTDHEKHEEEAMSEKSKPAATGDEEALGLLAKLRDLFGKTSASPAPAAAAAAPPPAAAAATLTGEALEAVIAAAVDARMQAAEVERDLQVLAATVPPAVLANSETRGLLLQAKATSPARYATVLSLLASQDASALLGGPIASAEQAGEGVAGLAVNAKELAALNALGLDAKTVGQIESKYGLKVN